jgi:hypothetical protein
MEVLADTQVAGSLDRGKTKRQGARSAFDGRPAMLEDR